MIKQLRIVFFICTLLFSTATVSFAQSDSLRVSVANMSQDIGMLVQQVKTLHLEVEALKMAQTKTIPQEDERQQQLHIEYTQAKEVEDEPSQENEDDAGKPPQKPRTKRGKKRLSPEEKFAHIPVKETTVLIPEEVEKNPELWEKVGETSHFELVVNPATVHRHKIIQEKYRCKADRDAQRPQCVALCASHGISFRA